MAEKYRVTAVSVRLSEGVLVLTKEQAAPRAHNLDNLGRGRYEIRNPVEFKAGEEIGYEGKLPKALVAGITEIKSSQPAVPEQRI